MRNLVAVVVVAVVAVLLTPALSGAQSQQTVPVKAVPVLYEPPQPKDGDVFLEQRFVPILNHYGGGAHSNDPFGLPTGAVMPMSDCPDGWAPYVNDKGKPLYFPFGLMVDAEGNPDVGSYALIPACEKQ